MLDVFTVFLNKDADDDDDVEDDDFHGEINEENLLDV